MEVALKEVFVDRLWALASLEELEPAAVASAAGLAWEVDEEPPPPSRRHAWQRFAYSGLVHEPFASLSLGWQPERRVGRLELTPTRILRFDPAELEAALTARGAPHGDVGVAPPLGLDGGIPFASARSTEVVYVVRAGRLRCAFESLSLRRAEIAPPG